MGLDEPATSPRFSFLTVVTRHFPPWGPMPGTTPDLGNAARLGRVLALRELTVRGTRLIWGGGALQGEVRIKKGLRHCRGQVGEHTAFQGNPGRLHGGGTSEEH